MTEYASRDARSVTKWAFVIAGTLALGVAFQQSYRVKDAIESADGGPVNDFDRWMIMTPRFLHGHPAYVDDNLPTPPLSLIVFAPFTAVSRPVAQFLWACLKWPLVSLAFLLSAGIVNRSGMRLSGSSLVLIFACWWLPVVVDMQEGQVNFLALVPLLAALYVAQHETATSDVFAGLLLGLGTAIKVTPVIFVAYFLLKRRWIAALSAVTSTFVWLFLIPALAFGWSQNLRWMTEWGSIMIVPYVTRGTVVYSTTQSVGSFALRMLSSLPAFEIHRDRMFEYGYMNVAVLSGTVVHSLVRLIMLAVGAIGLAWMWRPLATFRSPRYVLEIGAVAAFMLWFSERTWVHHYVSFLPTLCAAGMILSDRSASERGQTWLKGALIVFSGVSAFASEAGRLLGPHGVEWAKALGVFLWPSVLVTIVTLGAAAGKGNLETAPPLCYQYATRRGAQPLRSVTASGRHDAEI